MNTSIRHQVSQRSLATVNLTRHRPLPLGQLETDWFHAPGHYIIICQRWVEVQILHLGTSIYATLWNYSSTCASPEFKGVKVLSYLYVSHQETSPEQHWSNWCFSSMYADLLKSRRFSHRALIGSMTVCVWASSTYVAWSLARWLCGLTWSRDLHIQAAKKQKSPLLLSCCCGITVGTTVANTVLKGYSGVSLIHGLKHRETGY